MVSLYLSTEWEWDGVAVSVGTDWEWGAVANRPVLSPSGGSADLPPPPSPPALEESFTIHLGTQLKQMYNLRLIAADVLQPFSYPGR